MSNDEKPSASRRTRAVTAGLSAVGAAAGVGGLAYGAHDMARAVRAGRKIPLKTKALVPLEVAGLGGELMATKILHADAKKPKGQTVTKSIGVAQRNGVGRRIVEEPVSKARRFDPEADRQRRLGTYAGLAGGGAILAGDRLAREVTVQHGTHNGKSIRLVGLKHGKRGLAAAGATAALTGLSLGAVRRGVSERNQTWN